ncbi:MAG: HAMP domain-containing protein [Actinobacteria bacterium]|nr:HAMP domain-containing protein [Actinomycetota bacterium]
MPQSLKGSDINRRRAFRVSILSKILGVLIAVVFVAVLVTDVLEARLTTSALAVESRNAVQSQLQVLSSAFEQRERTLNLVLRAYAERLFAQGLADPQQRNALEADLGRVATTLRLDLLLLTDQQGNSLAGTGPGLDPNELPPPPGESLPSNRLITTQQDRHLRIVQVPVGSAGLSLIAGNDFDAALAYMLRSHLGGSGEVILVVDGRVAGSTLPGELVEPPGVADSQEDLPGEPVGYENSGEALLVAYTDLASGEPVSAALGVALTDPVAPLNDALSRVRIVSSLVLAMLAVVIGWILFRSITRPLVALSKTAQRISEGDLDATFTAERNDEIGSLAASLQKMTYELKATASRLQSAAKRVMAAQEEERQHLARDLHDGMQQRLVGLAIKLRRAEHAASENKPLALGELATEAEDAAFALQEIGRGIYPSVLADQGLAAALRSSASRLPMTVSVDVDPRAEGARLGPEIEGTIFFAGLEAMNNAQKYAPDAHLKLHLAMETDAVILTVADDGPGFDPAGSSEGSGLQGITDRIRAVGGETVIESQPGAGTRIAFKVPVDVVAGTQTVPDSRR